MKLEKKKSGLFLTENVRSSKEMLACSVCEDANVLEDF
jgi:hypothetical protein